MIMNSKPRLFGLLFYGNVTLAILTLLGLGVWEWWPTWHQSWKVRALARGLRDSNPVSRRLASEGLAQIGPASVPWLLEAARDGDPDVRAPAFEALSRMSLPRSALPTLRAGLKDADTRVRCAAADYLAQFRLEVPALADDLTEVLNDQDPDVRFRAARALWLRKGHGSEAAIQALIGLAGSPAVPHNPGRFEVVRLIQHTEEKAQLRAISALIPLIDAKDPTVRREAVECLAAFGPQAHAAVPSLERILDRDDRVLRCLAASALSGIEGWDKDRVEASLGPLIDDLALPPQMRQTIDSVTKSNLVRRNPEYVRSLGKSLETCLRQAQGQADRFNQRVDELIQVTRAEGGAGAINIENFQLVRLLEELVADCTPEAEAQGCRLSFLSRRLVTVKGEHALINRAFENVLRNAIRRAPAGSAVEVEVRAQLERATVSIRDRGPDVPLEALGGLFKPYYRAAKNRVPSSGGAAHGLAVAHRAIELHRGTMIAANARPGLVVFIELDCQSGSLEKPVRADDSAANSESP
jgi:signal transduction histidine kinase